MCKKADQKFSVQTFDQQLYAIAQQIKWANPLEFPDHIIRLGGFHALSCFIASVGKLWGDGGLTDLFVDSGVYAAGTVDQMLSGKQFNRSVRGLTLVYEATMSLWLSSFFDWCGSNSHLENIPDEFWDSLQTCYSSFSDDPPSRSRMHNLRRFLFVVLSVPYMFAPGIPSTNFQGGFVRYPITYTYNPCWSLRWSWSWREAYYCRRNENNDLTIKICELKSKLDQCQTELDGQKNVTATSEAELLKRISTSIAEQNSLWLKCIIVTPGRDCDITQGCATKDRTCRPINV
ncbi:unnamed protein product [Mytilus edulis]|uniref:Uncharacterized protein n=1 Tax=Mytilus edulis TaxID=6550 RepID=A0A8S3PYR4_MYTED|nr:unnamed protein product [Mytilus edulis]